ncbi:hypothetical protein ACFXTN_039080 [Malus domestica]
MILSPTLLTSTTSCTKVLSTMMPTPFLVLFVPEYQSLNPEFSRSFALLPTHLVSCRHIIFILLLTITSTTSIDFPVKVPIFHVPKRILLS